MNHLCKVHRTNLGMKSDASGYCEGGDKWVYLMMQVETYAHFYCVIKEGVATAEGEVNELDGL